MLRDGYNRDHDPHLHTHVVVMNLTELDGKVLALDGCPIDCARKTLEQHGITGFQHLRVTDLGLKKGQSPANAQNVGVFHQAALQILEKPGETQGACCG